MNQTIRSFIAKIPLVKPLYHALKRRRDERRIRCEQAKLRKNQPITKQGTQECFDDMPLKVHWELTEACNYRCSYCFNKFMGYKNVFCTLEEAEAAVKHLAMANRPSYQVSLLGGEPTLHPYLSEIIAFLSDSLGKRLEKISIITNGSFNDKTMEAMLMATTKTCIEVKVSLHFEFLQMERIKEIIERMSKDVSLVFLVMVHPKLFEKVKSAVDELCELRHNYPFDIAIKLIRDVNKESHLEELYTSDHYKWAEDVRARFKEIAQKTNLKGPAIPREVGWEFVLEGRVEGKMVTEKNVSTDELVKKTNCRFLGLFCSVGTSVIDIKPNGTTRGLVCNLANDKFNIYKENPFRKDGIIIKTIQCTKERCNCNVDWRVPKFKSASEAEEFIKMCRSKQQQLIESSPLYDAAI